MIYKATIENQSALLSLPESGMGYQLISARFGSEYKNRKLIVLNSEIFIEYDKSEWLYFNKIVREGWEEIKASAKEQLIQGIEFKSKNEYKQFALSSLEDVRFNKQKYKELEQ